MPTLSEELFERFCEERGIPFEIVATAAHRTPDYLLDLGGVKVACEVKQIDPNDEDSADLAALRSSQQTVARCLRNRLSAKLKNISGQLRRARDDGHPTLLVVLDNTPFSQALDHDDVLEGMFGEFVFEETIDQTGKVLSTRPHFGKNRRVGPGCNESMSALAVLRSSAESGMTLSIYHNPFAAVQLEPSLLEKHGCTTRLAPGDTHVSPWG